MHYYTKQLEENNIDVMWISNDKNKRYLTNFTGSTSEVFITINNIYIMTDGRYQTQVYEEVFPNVKVIIADTPKSYYENTLTFLSRYKTVGIESEHISISQYNKISDDYTGQIICLTNFVENQRLTKNSTEVEYIKKACQISDDCLEFVKENIKIGMTEVEIQVMIESFHILNGGEKICHTIVASGENSAKPHAVPSNRQVKQGDIITLDIGVFYKGYCSDITRTFFLGNPCNDELTKIYNIVLEANRLQTAAVKPGVKASEIDKIGRNYIEQQGYGDKFIHGTGHGIGLDIHEEPYITQTSKSILEKGNVITIEPGIYIEGLGGVRIENDILVTESGYEVLNKAPMDL